MLKINSFGLLELKVNKSSPKSRGELVMYCRLVLILVYDLTIRSIKYETYKRPKYLWGLHYIYRSIIDLDGQWSNR